MEKIIHDVLLKLEENNFEAYLVGGYVRDYLKKIKTTDIDICTNATPKDIINIFKEYKTKSLEYGNVIFKIDKYSFEITTFRKELKYKDNRKVIELEYINSLEEDLLRRDFTINTICMNKEGKIIDLLHGRFDLNKKIIKTVGDPFKKIEEDVLRILRAIRFATTLNFKLDNNLKQAIIKNKYLLKNLSYERKKEELTKIFISDNAKYGINLLKELDLLEVLELKNINNVLLTKDVLGKWSTIVKLDTYPFTKNEKDLINDINLLMKEDLNDIFVLYKYGLYTISVVCDLKKLNKKKIIKKYESLPIKDKQEIAITTNEICAILKKEPGSFLKTIYDDLEEVILNKKITNTKEEIISYINNNY